MANVSFALVLNLHQPAWNLGLSSSTGSGKRRRSSGPSMGFPARFGAMRTWVGFTFRCPAPSQDAVEPGVSAPSVQHGGLWVAAVVFAEHADHPDPRHSLLSPVLPLIPRVDWDEQLERWQGIGQHLFNRPGFSGFWPPEMGFCMELIPTLKRWESHYVLVYSEHVQAVTPMRWEELRYRPHIARFGGEEIIVVTRDREVSNARREEGTRRFIQEGLQRTKYCEFPPLVTTCTDGENGGGSGIRRLGKLWGYLYQGLMERVRTNQSGGIHPVFIDEYLDIYGAHGEVSVGPGTWIPAGIMEPTSSNGQVRRHSRRP